MNLLTMKHERYITENIELNLDLMKQIKGFRHIMPHKRLEAAENFVDGILRQLCPEDRQRAKAYINGEGGE